MEATEVTDHAHALETSTGLDSRKLAIWTFIGSECMFFATLISNYLVHKGKSLVGPFAHKPWTDPASGKMLLGWLAATLFCGMFFVGMQVYEFTHFVHKGLTLQRNMFGASFFVLTGFHGTHVTIGVIWLATMFYLALRRKLPPERSLNLEMAALYWHFVDVVWIIIFPVVYLIR